MSTDAAPSGQQQTDLSAYAAEEIRALMGRRDIGKRELARRLGVNDMWVGRRLRGQLPIGLDELQRIAVILGVDAIDLLPKGVTGRYPTRPPGPRTIAAIGQDRPTRSIVRTNGNTIRPHRAGRAVSATRPLVPLDRRTPVSNGR